MELEKQIIDVQAKLTDSEARISYKEGRVKELEMKVENLEKIRKDIMCTVSQGELPLIMIDDQLNSLKKERNLPYSGVPL